MAFQSQTGINKIHVSLSFVMRNFVMVILDAKLADSFIVFCLVLVQIGQYVCED